mmetsp:Transcript_47614/g.83799  ORF Transcript_47614/g.83799 Transcript_47614/m.83799 type:complete len:226 (-) Transcript_47614:25-702(-)
MSEKARAKASAGLRQTLAGDMQQPRRRAASAAAEATTRNGLQSSGARSPAAALRASRSGRLTMPSATHEVPENSKDFWNLALVSKEVKRPLTWYQGQSPVSIQRASFTDVSKHRDLLKPPLTSGDYLKELAWKRAFGHNPLEMSLQSTQRGDFATVDFQKHRELISPAATVYSRRRITDKKNRTLTANHGQRDGTEARNMKWWSAEEMASCRSLPAFTSWHEQVA